MFSPSKSSLLRCSSSLVALTIALNLEFSAQAQNPVPVTAGGISGADNTNWLTNGLATLNGATSGVDWTVSGLREGQNADWVFVTGNQQRFLDEATVSVEWPAVGVFSRLGYILDSTTIMGIGSAMASDVVNDEGTFLRISQVVPAPGDYTLNGVTQTATSLGQVLLWTTPVASLIPGDTLTFSSTAPNPQGATSEFPTLSAGPIGFSATTIPEPTAVVLSLASGAALLGLARRRRAAFAR